MKNWRVDDVMTMPVITVAEAAPYRAVVDLLIGNRLSAVPVVDAFERVIGVVSEADLLRKIEYAGAEKPRLFEGRRRRGERTKAAAPTAGDLMSSPAVTASTGMSIAAAARLMDSENVKRLPVVDELGRLIGIVSRSDLLKVHLRPDDDIRGEVEERIVRLYLDDVAGKVRADVQEGMVTLTGRVDRWSSADIAGRLTRQIPGVVGVVDELSYDYDDREILGAGIARGVA
ncbi:CBS domain-containing protein [Couchioplanes azureus]|uniref:CBS domain-containing protein n=1 Tax=Couchioplanes caeruleus TaxID=56438 RepID=UPI001670BABF|nr:CBS domain-containing protein [Couchioplanes caeruleus]GGQ84641.1 hypothetical protein GCM10010166_63550 [Couchioplanes caeruleus subsp. azureus]